MTIIKWRQKQVLRRMWGNWNSHTLLVEMSTGVIALEHKFSVSYKTTINPSNSAPMYLPKKNESMYTK